MESSNVDKFSEILLEMRETYEKKNSDYGNSFAETIQEFGFIPAVARINDKVKRMKNIVKGQKMNIKNESLRDAILDTSVYCILTIMELDNQK
jgi:peptide subunit release factor 1 (eRF1)